VLCFCDQNVVKKCAIIRRRVELYGDDIKKFRANSTFAAEICGKRRSSFGTLTRMRNESHSGLQR